jgi:ribose transport system ATP-binding protein
MILLSLKNICKAYPGVKALIDVDFDLVKGEVHALVGENGAGKSTLMKILAGAESMDQGKIFLEGVQVDISDPQRAHELGISMIYQEYQLIPNLTVAENIFLGRIPIKGPFKLVDWRLMRTQAEDLLQQLGIHLDVKANIESLSVAQQQIVEIVKALSYRSRILIMDEPTATLTQWEQKNLFALIRRLKQQDLGIIYISHRIEEIFEIADRVTVLRDGQKIATHRTAQIDKNTLIKEMVGRELTEEYPKQYHQKGQAILTVYNLASGTKLTDISFTLYRGEILGITGLVGAGKTELAKAIFGLLPLDQGEVHLKGQKIVIHSPRDAIRMGIALLPENRQQQGLVMGMRVRENISLAHLLKLSHLGIINRRQEEREIQPYIKDLKIKTPTAEEPIKNLSGGNQQKVVLAKWLFTQCKLIIFDEPTRGIDIGAKVGIYQLMDKLVDRGIGVIMISSELPEILGMCDRILIMNQGRIVAELTRDQATQEKIMGYATRGI